jgi:putative addiction module component (TIGR02574 family)
VVSSAVPVKLRAIFEEALRLPERERADLAGRLILSLHPDADEQVEAAWAAEIDRRLDGFEASKARSVPWSQVKKSLRQAQRARSRRKAAS